MKKNPTLQRLYLTFQLNKSSVSFGRYSAELCFYILFALFPLMLALANLIAVLPFTHQEILAFISKLLPDEIEHFVIGLLTQYLSSTSSSAFSLSLLISLWPASNVFNTLQRLMNRIYRSPQRKNFIVARIFAYIFTVLLVIGTVVTTFFIVFGEQLIIWLYSLFQVELFLLTFLSQQGWIIVIISMFMILLMIYHFMPNVDWPMKYAIPGSITAFVGIALVTQLFPIYLSFTNNNLTQDTIGVVIIFIIWLYLIGMVLAFGAFVNIFYYDYSTKSLNQLIAETRTTDHYLVSSENYSPYLKAQTLNHSIQVNPSRKEAR